MFGKIINIKMFIIGIQAIPKPTRLSMVFFFATSIPIIPNTAGNNNNTAGKIKNGSNAQIDAKVL